jgi:hypothetical protein
MGVHCVAHWTNLAIQSLGDLTLIAHIEVLIWTCMVILLIFQTCGISKSGSNLGYKREQFFLKCENMVDVHARAIEENNGRILLFAMMQVNLNSN